VQTRKLHAARSTEGLRRLLVIGALAALIVGGSAMPAQAAIERNQDIDNTLAEFDRGAFQLTASAQYPTGSLIAGDQQGAVQMAPIADLRTMSNSTDLPFGRRQAGVVAVGRNIFVIGGLGPDAQNSNDVRQASVYVSQVELDTGALGAWQSDPALPAVQHVASNATPIAPRSRIATAAYVTGQDSGYIYVLGGEVSVGGNSLSSYSVLRGTVENGRVTTWNEADPMPNIPNIQNVGPDGIEAASAFVAQLPNGRVFLYLIGGLQRFKPGFGPVEEFPSRYILYAEIDPASGKFLNSNQWILDTSIPAPPTAKTFTIPLNPVLGPNAGIWNSTVTGGVFNTTDGLSSDAVFYVMGGLVSLPGTATSEIFRADINTGDGTLTLSNPSGAGAGNASLGAARSSMAAVQYQGSVYVTGGVLGGALTQSVLGSYVQPDNRFPELGGPGSSTYFISTDTLGKPGLPAPRAEHGAVVVPYPATNPVGAHVYVIGGSNGTASQSRVYRSEIGNSSATDVSYPLEGYYVSAAVPFLLANATLKQIFWYTDQTNGGDIKVDFRTSADNDCSTLATRSATQVPWNATNPGSTTGLNTFAITPLPANCFQYRVRMTPGGSGSSTTTPYLLRLGIVIEVPGATDLTITDVAFAPPSSPQSMTITLHNENIFLTGEPTLAADYGANGPGSFPGSFFVDVFVYPPGVTPPDDQPIPTGPGPYAALSIDVLRSEMQAGPNGTGFDLTLTISPQGRQACDYNTLYNSQTCSPRQISQVFTQVGTYNVVVVVDGDNNVDERPNGPGQAEANNVFKTTVNVTEVPKVTYYANMPLIVAP
jgi:hypothetical protein